MSVGFKEAEEGFFSLSLSLFFFLFGMDVY